MPLTRDNIRDIVLQEPPARFVERHLFDCIPHLFSQDRSLYVSWKRTLASKIDVDPACLTIVGGAALGFSMNPNKNFKLFDDRSDVDVAVISGHYFSLAWRFFRNNGRVRARADYRTKVAWDEHVSGYIYWGTIATDKLLGVLPFGREWLAATSQMSQLDPTRGRDVKLRVYADHEALRTYQQQSVRGARQLLDEGK